MSVVAVGIPARDEAELLPRCLASLAAAADRLLAEVPDAVVRVVVALDSCTDSSADVLATARAELCPPGSALAIAGMDVAVGAASRARQAACRAALAWSRCDHGPRPDAPGASWIATTDADTTVPDNWFTAQHRAALEGFAVFAGTAQPNPAELSRERLRQFHARHRLTLGHEHVHGASLGMSAAAFATTGGFAPLEVGEDQDLVDRARALGLPVLASDEARVTTSARAISRVHGGFATYLAALPQ